MSDGERYRKLLHSLNAGVALINPDTWVIEFENAKFFQWFPPEDDTDETLDSRLPGLDVARARTRLERRRSFTYECETRADSRPVPVRIDLRTLSDESSPLVIVECVNISKQKESDYMLESYSKMAEKNARDLQKEKERVEKLLLNVMPRTIYEEIKDFGTTAPQRFDKATILMLDFVDFTEMSVAQDPSALVAELNDIFSAFDRIVELFDCERIKTMGDGYMAVSGLPESAPDHAHNVARVALRFRRYLQRRNAAHHEAWNCRIGINTGPVIGSIVGVQKYVYDIFGPGVNLAARMEEASEAMRITVSDNTYDLLKDDFLLSERGDFDIKGFGNHKLYYLERDLKGRN